MGDRWRCVGDRWRCVEVVRSMVEIGGDCVECRAESWHSQTIQLTSSRY